MCAKRKIFRDVNLGNPIVIEQGFVDIKQHHYDEPLPASKHASPPPLMALGHHYKL
jgi:hypothetical protein